MATATTDPGPPPTERAPHQLIHESIMARAFGGDRDARLRGESDPVTWDERHRADFARAYGDENEAVPDPYGMGGDPEVGEGCWVGGESITCKPRLPDPGLVSFEPPVSRKPPQPEPTWGIGTSPDMEMLKEMSERRAERSLEAIWADEAALPTEAVLEWLEGLEEPLTPLELAQVTGAGLNDVKLALWELRLAGRVVTTRRRRLADGTCEWSYPGSFWRISPRAVKQS